MKNITKDEIDDLIVDFFEYKEKDPFKRNQYKLELFGKLDVYRSYKNGYEHIKFFNPKRKRKNNGDYFYSFESETTNNTNSSTKERRNKNYQNNLELLRLYQNGDKTKELSFEVDGIVTNMEKSKVRIIKEDGYTSTNFDLHHIATINNHSRDKIDIDPNKWLIMTDLTSYKKIKISSIVYDTTSKIVIINNKEYEADTVKLSFEDGELICYHKSKSIVDRMMELISIMIIPIDEHGLFHKFISKNNKKSFGYSDYNIDALPFALRSKQNYDYFVNTVCEDYNFNKNIFRSFEDHVNFLEV